MKRLQYFVTGLAAIVLIVFAAGCGKSNDKTGSPKSESRIQKTQVVGTHSQAMSAERLQYVYTADTLYSCAHHPEVVMDHPEAVCPQCSMKLDAMSQTETAELRASQSRGCPMCNIVLPADSGVAKCPTCGMDLVTIQNRSTHRHPE
jgi:hypothetical protein